MTKPISSALVQSQSHEPQRIHEGGPRFPERFEIVEQRLDHHRFNEKQEHEDGQGGEPEMKPPAPRAAPYGPVGNPSENDCDDEADQLGLGPVPEPRTPALNGLIVAPVEPMFKRVE